MCYRDTDRVSMQKTCSKHVEGNAIKFNRDDLDYTLLAFATDMLAHTEHGFIEFYSCQFSFLPCLVTM